MTDNLENLEAVFYTSPIPHNLGILTFLGLVFDRIYFPNVQTISEVSTRHFNATVTGHFSAFHIDFLRVKRYLGYSTIGLYSFPFRLEIIAFLRRDLQ